MLPHSLQEIAEIIGNGLAVRLSADFGGTEIYIPKKAEADHPLVQAIGHDAAGKLAAWAGGSRLEIPRAVGFHGGRRQAQIKADVEAGLSKKQAARKHLVTTRWVRKICNDERRDDTDQGKLF